MKILFLGDSITDMGRYKDHADGDVFSLGIGYVALTAAKLKYRFPNQCEIINKGVSGNRVVDLYARIKSDVWNLEPDMVSILIGVNDVWHEIGSNNGVDIERWEKVYRMLIEDTKKALPKARLVIMEPFVLKGSATEAEWSRFCEVKKYAKIARRIAREYKCKFVPLQKDMDEFAAQHGTAIVLYDGVHPDIAGAKIISDNWIKTVFGEDL